MFVVTLHLKENIKKHKSKINIIDQFYDNEMIKYMFINKIYNDMMI